MLHPHVKHSKGKVSYLESPDVARELAGFIWVITQEIERRLNPSYPTNRVSVAQWNKFIDHINGGNKISKFVGIV